MVSILEKVFKLFFAYTYIVRFMIEYMYAKNLVMLYPNFPDQKSLSTNHYEEGIHSVPEGKEIQIPDRIHGGLDDRFTVPLFQIYEQHLLWNRLRDWRESDDVVVVSLYHRLVIGGLKEMEKDSMEYVKRIADEYPEFAMLHLS